MGIYIYRKLILLSLILIIRIGRMAIPKILVVDDSPALLVEALTAHGYEIEVASNGIEALNILKDKTSRYFKLIIVDLNMPVMNGWELIKSLKNDHRYENIPIIILTGSEEQEKEVVGLKSGADDYILKPLRIPNFLARVEALLRRVHSDNNNSIRINLNIAQNSDEEIHNISAREKEIVKLVAEGKNNHEIAISLSIQEDTVKAHLKNIYRKLNVSNRMQAAILALKLNLID
jgi:DNA-binding NarL/FixJ family response regulator